MLVYTMRHATTGSPLAVTPGNAPTDRFRQLAARQVGGQVDPITVCYTDSPLSDHGPVRLLSKPGAGRVRVTVGYLPKSGGAA